MFTFGDSPVPIRDDLREAFRAIWSHLAEPGPVFDARQRLGILAAARASYSHDTHTSNIDAVTVEALAVALYADPSSVDTALVRAAAHEVGDPATVETIAVVAMLSAVDGTHRALGVDLEPLPEPQHGRPTGNVAEGLRCRRTLVPMPKGAIPVALDLLPDVGEAYRSSFGPLYMTEAEMGLPRFERSPGLNRSQLELIAARTSFINECFY